ncbi:fucose 4-O-acetylase-like acetyltransferase [Weissella uvarum]|uniref:acyltransferase family protein n=1 Tax=Weissella uvarum TaxID=1479233 RepID=UPI001960B293|nr:acyltransferase family protein [Weissella uvarum]MBM7616733.1 fucose 4-O-acetylase-like acetyltransferase [Weissella uvarum]MCM0594814.1 acyltransferase family protein [Weissella uvarum]
MAQRITWIDFAKGGAILLVVLGHVLIGLFDANIYTGLTQKLLLISVESIYVFHMPFFFALSGYFFKAQTNFKSYGHFLKKRFISLGLPYFVFSIILWGLKFIGQNAVRTPYPFDSLLSIWREPIGPLWFIYVLLAVDVFIGFLSIYIKNVDVLFSLSLGLAILANLFPSDIYIVQRILIWSPLFLFGGVLKKHPIYKHRATIVLSAGSYLAYLAWWISTNPTDRISYSVPGWSMLILFISILLGLSLFVRIPTQWRGYTYFTNIGRTSMATYLLHVPIVSLTRIVLLSCGISNIFIHILLGFSIGWFGTQLLYRFIHRYPWLDFGIYPNKYLQQKEH